MKTSPCLNCPYRKATCHDYCREYIEWHEEKVMQDKARAFDRFIEIAVNEILHNNRTKRRG